MPITSVYRKGRYADYSQNTARIKRYTNKAPHESSEEVTNSTKTTTPSTTSWQLIPRKFVAFFREQFHF